MILLRIDERYPDDIRSELTEVLDVAHAGLKCQRVDVCATFVRWLLVCDASDEEFGAIGLVEEMRALVSTLIRLQNEAFVEFELTLITTGSTSAATRAASTMATHVMRYLVPRAITAAHQHMDECETASNHAQLRSAENMKLTKENERRNMTSTHAPNSWGLLLVRLCP
jgi:hypothetical protein